MTLPVRVVGLKYEPGEGLPQVVLKTSGAPAEAILRDRRYRASAPQVVQDAELLEQLFRLPVDGRIGPELFRVVAILLAHVFAVEASLKGEPSA